MLTGKELCDNLEKLVHLDIDAIHAYDQAIEKIDVESIRSQITDFKRDHERHVSDLSEIIRSNGGEVPEFSRDFKGFFIEGFTALRSATGTEGALKAMQVNEKLTNSKYDDSLSWDVPQDVKDVLMRNREDERRHIEYITRCIDERLFEQPGDRRAAS